MDGTIVVIGASAGGVEALERVVAERDAAGDTQGAARATLLLVQIRNWYGFPEKLDVDRYIDHHVSGDGTTEARLFRDLRPGARDGRGVLTLEAIDRLDSFLVGQGLPTAVPDIERRHVEAFIADLDVVISNLVYGLSARFAAGEIAITDILPGLERAVYRLTSGYGG